MYVYMNKYVDINNIYMYIERACQKRLQTKMGSNSFR